jgi:adenosylcobyric acid synthase
MGKAIMIQGTSSGAGKSMISLALCRILSNKGYDVVPFKSQNMSLNSIASIEGGEMSFAQYLQAIACRKNPSWKFNPILLKPEGGSTQIIFKGKVLNKVSPREYMFSRKDKLFNESMKILDELLKEHEFVIIEGAGSPVEINLKNYDIANMKVAEHANAGVILVTDIERGGSFASIVGTMELFNEYERDRVIGFIFNKFRGDESMLYSGFKYLEDRYGKKVLGVVPYIENRIPQEDSLVKFPKIKGDLHIQIIKLPHISNFTDFGPLHWYNGVDYISRAEEVRGDVIIVPGSKSTVRDLNWMRDNGIEDAIVESYRDGAFVVGICGGYQMLGRKIIDNVETGSGEVKGMGILESKTKFEEVKRTNNLKSKILWEPFKNIYVRGYEIRMGRSISPKPFSIIEEINGISAHEYEGEIGEHAIGTYIHGLFYNMSFTEKLLNYIRKEKNLEPIDLKESLIESEIEKFAATVERSIDINYVLSNI